MYLQKKLKIMRKYDADFWSFMYVRRRKNNFFVNFRLSLVVKLVKLYYNNFFFTNIKSKKIFKKLTMKLKRNKSSLKIFFKINPIKIKTFFRKRLNAIKKIFFNFKYKIKSLNYKYGHRAAFKLFKTKKIKSPYSRLRLFLKRLHYFIIILVIKCYANLLI